jgi:hypothetical protein
MLLEMSAAKAALIDRIEALSEDEFNRVAPYLEADLESVADLGELKAAVEAGRRSAQSEPLVDDAQVRAEARALIDSRK